MSEEIAPENVKTKSNEDKEKQEDLDCSDSPQSEENVSENGENESIEDEAEEQVYDSYDDELEIFNDESAPSFGHSDNNVVHEDDTCETILHFLKLGILKEHRQEAVNEFIRHFDEAGYQEKLAKTIINCYIIPCPNAHSELGIRSMCVEAVMKRWPDGGALMLNAINAALTAVEPLKQEPSRNLYEFTRCCLDEKVFDGKGLCIYKNESTSLVDEHTIKLYIRINPTVPKEAPAESAVDYFEGVAETSHTVEEDHPKPTGGTVTESGTFRKRCRRVLSFISCGRI